jgi:hypothetical protein
MKLPWFGNRIDERFWRHRMRASAYGGIAAAEVCLLWLLYLIFFQHRWSWELAVAPAVFLAVKLTMMVWARFYD